MHVVLVCVTSRSDFSRKHVPFLFSKSGTNFSQLFHTPLYLLHKNWLVFLFFLDHSYSVIRDSVVFSIELIMQMLWKLLRWPKTKLSCNPPRPHRRITRVSFETYLLYSMVFRITFDSINCKLYFSFLSLSPTSAIKYQLILLRN